MDKQQRYLLQADVRRDIARLQAELAKLQLIDEYLSDNPNASIVESAPNASGAESAASEEQVIRRPPRPVRPEQFIGNITQVAAAEAVLRAAGAGHPMNARQLAEAIHARGFQREPDRDFATSLFSTMTRKPETFAKVGAGLWTLREFVSQNGTVSAGNTNGEQL